MAYTINKTNGSVLTTVADGVLDNTTDITLIGKNYAGYGEVLNENFVRLLENFANTTEPSNPINGQLWWDSTNSVLKVYNGSTSSFKPISSSQASTTAPSNPITGDLWWDTSNQQLKAYSGTAWITVGPAFTAGVGTSGAIVEQVTDSIAVTHTIVSLYTANTRVAIVSKDATFTPSPAISGFTTIRPGINLAATGVIANNGFTGLASDAATVDGLDSTDFMRSTANTSTTGTLAVNNNTGLTVGLNADARISVSSSNILFENQTNGGTMTMRVRSSGGVQSNAIAVANNGDVTFSGNITVIGSTTTTSTTNNFVINSTTESTSTSTGALQVAGGAGIVKNLYVGGNANVAGNLSVDGITFINGNITLGNATSDRVTYNSRVLSNIVPATDDTYELGNSALVWSTVYATTFDGVASFAEYADLAERYASDAVYTPGTVVTIGGDAEVTVANANDPVFGVISTNPAFLMNKDAGSNDTHPAIALIGRVPVRAVGIVKKGQQLVVDSNGVAKAATGSVDRDFVIGRSLVDKYSAEEKVIEVALSSH